MLLLDFLRLAVLAVLAWWLRPHAALLWRFAFPLRVRHRMTPGLEPPGGSAVVRELLAAGFVFLGRREETVGRILEQRTFFVLAHPDGIFADVPATSGAEKKIPDGLYFSSFVEGTLFLVTKRMGPEITRGSYVSQRETGSVDAMLRRHRAALAKLGLGLAPSGAVDAAAREKLFTVWHREHLRTELRPYAVLSGVLILVAAAFVVRMFTFSY